MSMVGYDNVVIENQVTDLTNTKLEVNALFTLDDSLTVSDGLKKVINKYTYTGKVEQLQKGAKNSVKGSVTFIPKEYEIKRYQQTFEYNDMDAMQDSNIVDVAMRGAAETMANDIKSEYFKELANISNVYEHHGFGYETIVDALAELNLEVEEGLFVIMGNDLRAIIRKDSEFIASKQGEILYTGQFGTLAGVPVCFSKLCPKGMAYITRKDQVTLMVKKEGSVETDRNIETKDNTVVYDRFGVMALTDDTKSIKLHPVLVTLTVSLTPGSGKLTLAAQTADEGYDFYYKASDSEIGKAYTDTDLSQWTKYTANTDIACSTKKYVAVIKVCKETSVVTGFGVSEATPN